MGLLLEEIECCWGGWFNGLIIDDVFVEIQLISEFFLSLVCEFEFGLKVRDELVCFDYMVFVQGYLDVCLVFEEVWCCGFKVGVFINNSLLVSVCSFFQCVVLYDFVDVVLSLQMIGVVKFDLWVY